MKLKQKDKAILRHEDELAKFLDLGGVKYTDIVDKINAFDWLDALLMRFIFELKTLPKWD